MSTYIKGINFIADNSIQTAIEKHNGVIMIESVEITDTLIHMDYLYKNQLCHFVYDKCKKKCYNNNGSFFAGIWPSFYFWIDGDQLMFVVTEDDINKIKNYIQDLFSLHQFKCFHSPNHAFRISLNTYSIYYLL